MKIDLSARFEEALAAVSRWSPAKAEQLLQEGNLMTLAIRSSERTRALEIVAALQAGDWAKFSSLSDEPFPNTASMKVQFDAIAGFPEFASKTFDQSFYAANGNNTTRIVRIYLRHSKMRDLYTLVISNTHAKSIYNDKISIMAILPDFSAYFGVVKH